MFFLFFPIIPIINKYIRKFLVLGKYLLLRIFINYIKILIIKFNLLYFKIN